MKQNYFKFSLTLFLLSFQLSIFSQITTPNCSINAGASATFCEGEEIKLSGSGNATVNTSTISWSQVSGPVVGLSDPSIYEPIVMGATGGNTYVFKLSVICANGLPTSQNVSITVSNAPLTSAGTNIVGCPGDYTLAATPVPMGYTGEWSVVSGNVNGVTFVDNTSNTTDINLPQNSEGDYVLEWRVTDGNIATCDGVSRISVTNLGGVTPVTAGGDVTLSACYDVNTSYRLNGSFAGVKASGDPAGMWELVSGPSNPNFNSLTNNRATVSPLITGSYTFKWTVDGVCTTGDDTVTITVPPAAGSVTNANNLVENRFIRICDDPSNRITKYVLAAAPPEKPGETVEWEIIQDPSTNLARFNEVSTANPVNNDFTSSEVSPTIYGLNYNAGGNNARYRIRYTVISGSSPDCTSSTVVEIKFIKNPLSVTLTDNGTASECVFATLNGSGEVDVTIGINKESPEINTATEYQIISGPVTTGRINVNAADDFTRTFTQIGTYVIKATREPINSGNASSTTSIGCSVASDEITVKISGTASGANAGTDQYKCLSGALVSATLAGNDVTGQGIGTWSQVNGPSVATISDANLFNTDVTGLIEGIYYFRWAVSSGPKGQLLTSNSDDVKVVVSNSTLSYVDIAGPDITVCAGSYQLNGRVPLES